MIFNTSFTRKNVTLFLVCSSLLVFLGLPSAIGLGSTFLLNALTSIALTSLVWIIGNVVERLTLQLQSSKTKKSLDHKETNLKENEDILTGQRSHLPARNLYKKNANFNFKKVSLNTNKVCYRALVNNKPISYAEALTLLETNSNFRNQFIQALKESPFKAYFWECPGVNLNILSQNFEFVLINSPQLAQVNKADPSQFSAKFKNNDDVAHFANLGKDAMLISPKPAKGKAQRFQSLSHFSRNAPLEQQHKLWQRVAQQAIARIQTNKEGTWLSTSGLDVSWLHVRLDSKPKYYHHAPYLKIENRSRRKKKSYG